MKIKELLKLFDIKGLDLPEIILEYEAVSYKDCHIEHLNGKEYYVFTSEGDDGTTEGILDKYEPSFHEIIKLPGDDVGRSMGGVTKDGYII